MAIVLHNGYRCLFILQLQLANLDVEKKSPKISPSITADNLEAKDNDTSQDLSKNEFTASDGKNYKFLGSQWSEILPSGKFGRLARKNISKELNKLAGREQVKKNKTVLESKQSVNQYQEKQDQESKQSVDQYQEKQDNGMGIFSILMVLVISVAAIILLLDTFKHPINFCLS